jgi:methionyl-tRNA formyltransferase
LGAPLNIAFLTTDDPLYLPSFFDRVLAARGDDVSGVFVVPPLYRDQTSLDAAWRYFRTFGLGATSALGRRTLRAKIRRQSIARVCRRHNVLCESIRNVNDPDFLVRLREIDTELLVSVSCPQIFEEPLIDLPPLGCLNVHGAILPEYRGIMPSFWMLTNEERRAGVSIFFVNAGIDAGDLCGQQIFDIRPDETLDQFLQRSKAVAADLLLSLLPEIESGTISRTPLDLAQGSYYPWPDRDAVRRFRTAGRRLW